MITFWKKATVLILLTVSTVFANAQTSLYQVGIGVGAYIYQGDLTPTRIGSLATMKPGINLYGSRLLTSSLSARLQLSIARLKGDDAKYSHPEYRQQRNFNFTTPLVEAAASIVWNPLRSNFDGIRAPRLTPYLSAGVGLSWVRINRDYSNFNPAYFGSESWVVAGLNTDIAHRTPRLLPVIPVGAGLQYELTPQWSLTADASYRFTFSDYLDGFSQAANPALKDRYFSTSIGIQYKIGSDRGIKCPVVRN